MTLNQQMMDVSKLNTLLISYTVQVQTEVSKDII
jgi:hypothetical protein